MCARQRTGHWDRDAEGKESRAPKLPDVFELQKVRPVDASGLLETGLSLENKPVRSTVKEHSQSPSNGGAGGKTWAAVSMSFGDRTGTAPLVSMIRVAAKRWWGRRRRDLWRWRRKVRGLATAAIDDQAESHEVIHRPHLR